MGVGMEWGSRDKGVGIEWDERRMGVGVCMIGKRVLWEGEWCVKGVGYEGEGREMGSARGSTCLWRQCGLERDRGAPWRSQHNGDRD